MLNKRSLRYRVLGDYKSKSDELEFHAVQPLEIETIRLWRNSQKEVLRQNQDISRSDQIDYFKTRVFPEYFAAHPSQILLSIYMNGKLVGYTGLVHVDWRSLRAEVSFLLSPEINEGSELYSDLFSRTLSFLTSLAFDNLRLNRLFTETFSNRVEHISILEKNEFQFEGRLREHVQVKGKRIDSLFHGKLASNNHDRK